uniref:SID1 transmembrane family member 1 n=1 Tax=Macrostomum lignano TaxID=282301 RepID=A0A1I8IS62_9PLAT
MLAAFLALPVALVNCQMLSSVEQVSGRFNQVYRGRVNSSVNYLYVFGFVEKANATQAVRVHVVSSSAGQDYPVLFVVRQQRSILSFQLPQILENEYYYSEVARTLCPVERSSKGVADKNQTIYIDVSSASARAVPFLLNVTLVRAFMLQVGQVYRDSVTPSRPKYYRVAFPPGVRHLSIIVESNDTACMIVSTQSVGCPVYDLVRNVEFTGVYQTMSSKAEITLGRHDFDNESFYIVFVMKPSQEHCSFTRLKDLQPKAPSGPYSSNMDSRAAEDALANATEIRGPSGEVVFTSKSFVFTVVQSLDRGQYLLPVFGAVAFFLAFHLIAFLILLVHWKVTGGNSDGDGEAACANVSLCCPRLEGDGGTAEGSRQRLNEKPQPSGKSTAEPASYGSTVDGKPRGAAGDRVSLKHPRSDTSGAEADANSDTDDYRLYYWYLIIVSIFYGLPVVQLVITYQQILRISGNQDICYYNFYCTRPLGVISAFNNVFSNIGYIMLGLLFLGLTRRRDLLDRRRRNAAAAVADESDSQSDHRCLLGIPQHFGIFYAMGIALIMEGIMSGCYHVCPSYSNFQFDTAYMYVLAVLCMLKIYQTRHPDINASAHVACMAMAIVIFVSVVGVVYGTVFFWAAFTVFFILSSLFLTGEVYYMGHWKVNVGLFRRFYLLISSQGIRCFKPMYKDRMVILVTANLINWTIAIFGAVRQPQDFNSFLLYIFLVNLLMYIAFYVVMKVRSGEKIRLLTTLFVVASCITWAAGLYFFMQRPSNWAKSPADSRALNQRCLLLDFYDIHDIWHFLSSMSLFFSFMVLLTLDDDLVSTPRHQIPVF